MSLTRNNPSFATGSDTPSSLQVSQDLQSEAALPVVLRRFSQLAAHDGCDSATLDRLKTLLRLLISNEGRQLGASLAVENSNQASVVAAAAAARRVDLRRYKTELCRSFAETGQCRYGMKCQFAHGADELRPLARHPRYRTELCHSFHVTGFCPYGSRCNFIHSDATAVTEASTSSGPAPTCGVLHPSALPVLQRSPDSFMVLKQLLMQSNDAKQRAICGRPEPSVMRPVAMLHALDSSQLACHMKLTQDH